MAENPLLPNAELVALLALLRHAFAHPAPRPLAGQQALLTAPLQQLRDGDGLVLSAAALPWAMNLLAARPKRQQPRITAVAAEGAQLLTAAGLAAALARRPDSDALAFTALSTHTPDPGWPEALRWAATDHLPLILACADASGPAAFRAPVTQPAEHSLPWPDVLKLAQQHQLPILTVDGQDAVAVYRTAQESVLRARARGGPALLWAILPNTKPTPRANAQPLTRLEEYLRVRNITYPAKKEA